MILLWGIEEDTPMDLVRTRLDDVRSPYLFLNQADVLDLEVEIQYGPKPSGWLQLHGTKYDLAELTSFYLRPYDFREFPDFAGLAPDSAEWRHAIRCEDILCGYAEVSPALVVNRPSTMLSNNSKPYQCRIIEQFGFRIPRTLLTTDAAAVRQFSTECRDVVYKSISGQRSIVQRFRPSDEARLQDIRWCPTQFQEWIPGDDYRVHVVGQHTFTTRVQSAETDYRYGAAVYQPAELPPAVSRRSIAAAAHMGLQIAGMDLRRTPDGEWYCFEVNPCPAYSCYELTAGQPISGALAGLLACAGTEKASRFPLRSMSPV